MLKEKEYYQTLIENSVLFFQNIPPESVLYKKELLKLIENIYHYLTLVSEQNQQYSVEIVETVKECVKNYDDSKGKFLHYFNFCLKKKKTKIITENILSEHTSGMHIPQKDKFVIKTYFKFIVAKNGEFKTDNTTVTLIANATRISEEFVRECLYSYKNSTALLHDLPENADLWENLLIPDNSSIHIEDMAVVKEILQFLNEFFTTRQPRQKPLLSQMITAKICSIINDYHELLIFVKDLDFFDKTIFADFQKTHTPPLAKDIAINFGVSEQSISRTYKTFSRNAYRYITEKRQTTD